MKLHIAVLLCALLGLVLGRFEPPSGDQRNHLNSSDALFDNAHPDWPDHALADDTPPPAPEDPDDVVWRKAVCRGEKLLRAMTLDEAESSHLLAWPYTQSPWNGPMYDELYTWGYLDNEAEHDMSQSSCDFSKDWLGRRAFEAMGVDFRSIADGGDNECFYLKHFNGPIVKRDRNGVMPYITWQRYDVAGREYRSTGAHAKIGINRRSGIVHLIDRYSAESAAVKTWGTTRADLNLDDLPRLRSTSDLAWALWNRNREPSDPGVQSIKMLIAWNVVNEDTADVIVKRILTRRETFYGLPEPWPGTDVIVGKNGDTEADRQEAEDAAALVGSPNGIAAAYFLLQHKRQLGGAKFIWKIKIWTHDVDEEDDDGSAPLPNLNFYVDMGSSQVHGDGMHGEAVGNDAKEELKEQLREVELSDGTLREVEQKRGEGVQRSFIREHLIRAKL